MELKKLAPWNWFSKEENQEGNVPVRKTPDRSWMESGGLQPGMDSLLAHFFGSPLGTVSGERHSTPLGAYGLLKPRVDLRAEDNAYILTVEIPGVNKEEVQINIDNNTMTITGEKKQEKETKKANYYRMERSYGAFQRVLSLPDDVDQEQIAAHFQQGVLTVTMPRQEVIEHQGKPIEITTS